MSGGTWTSLSNVQKDLAVTKPLPITFTHSGNNPANLGPPWNRWESEGPKFENFNVPVYQPDPTITPHNCIINQGQSITCPIETLKLRNHWETFNTTNAKHYGGYDAYNAKDVPSCTEINGNYANFQRAFSNPWNTVMVPIKELPVEYNLHSF